MLFLWFYHACKRGAPRFMMVADHANYLTFEDPGAVHTVRRALNLARAGDLYGAAETAGVDVSHARTVSEGLRRGMRFAIGAEVDNDPRSRPDAQNIVDAMRPDGIIRSVHFISIDHAEKGANWPWPFDNPEFAQLFEVVGTERTWELYTAKLFDDIEKLPGHVVGNFYAPAAFGHWPARETLERYEDRLIELCLERHLAIEINTRFLYRDNAEELKTKYLEATARLLRKAVAKKVPIAIGSSAHSPKDQGNAFDAILKLLDESDVNELVFPVGGRLARVVLRASREHIEAQTKREETVTTGSSISGLGRAELGLPEEIEPRPTGRKRVARDVGPKKRASAATRVTKRPEPSTAATKSTSRRTAESSSSSSVAKAARKDAPAKKTAPMAKGVEPKKPIAKAAPAKKTAAQKPAAKKPATAKPATKAASAKSAAKKAVTPKKAVAAKKPVAKKSPVTAKKPVAKKAVPKKPVSAKKAVATKKPVAKKGAATAKKPAVKKTVAKTAAVKKPVVKKPAGKKPVAAKKPAKKAAPKKSAAKRR